MKCPTDDTTLQLAERHGIEIDYCPACRGVWLDRGELDKVIDRAEPPRLDPDHDGHRRDRGHHGDDDDDHPRASTGGSSRRKRKRGGFLGELFEFGDS